MIIDYICYALAVVGLIALVVVGIAAWACCGQDPRRRDSRRNRVKTL